MVRSEAVGLSGAHGPSVVRRTHRQHLLLETSLDDRDGAGRDVVIVPAGVVARRPAQQPDVDVRITMHLHVVATLVAERHVRSATTAAPDASERTSASSSGRPALARAASPARLV